MTLKVNIYPFEGKIYMTQDKVHDYEIITETILFRFFVGRSFAKFSFFVP